MALNESGRQNRGTMSPSSAQTSEIRSPIVASWVLLIGTCLLALIPLIGFFAWIIGGVTILIAIVLAIVVISKGGTWHGIFILLASMVFVPIFIFFAAILSTLIFGAAVEGQKSPRESSPTIEHTTGASDSAADASGEIEETAAGFPGEAQSVSAEAEEAVPIPDAGAPAEAPPPKP